MPMDNSKTARARRKDVADNRKQRSAKDQLKALDSRLGKGVGATRERAKLEAQL
jgi:hypothetical protein